MKCPYVHPIGTRMIDQRRNNQFLGYSRHSTNYQHQYNSAHPTQQSDYYSYKSAVENQHDSADNQHRNQPQSNSMPIANENAGTSSPPQALVISQIRFLISYPP